MRKIESHETALTVCGARNARKVKGLAGAVLHSRPEHEGNLRTQLLQRAFDFLDRYDVFHSGRRKLDQRGVRIEPMPFELRGDRMAVGGERARLDENFLALAARMKEGREHQVQIG